MFHDNDQIIFRLDNAKDIFTQLKKEINFDLQGMSVHDLLEKLIDRENKKVRQIHHSNDVFADIVKQKIRKKIPRIETEDPNREYIRRNTAHTHGPFLLPKKCAREFPKFVESSSPMTELYMVWFEQGETFRDALERCWSKANEEKFGSGSAKTLNNETKQNVKSVEHNGTSVTITTDGPATVTINFQEGE